jgi:uncharacterized membrane protein
MRFSPIQAFHICTGVLGFLSGAMAMSFRKGSRRHGLAGSVFVVSMLSLSASGAYLALMKHQPGNVLGGTLTFYLVTAWMTAKHKAGERGIFDWGALLAVLAIGVVTVTCGLEAANSQTGIKHGYAAGPYFFLGSVALLGAAGDIRLLTRGVFPAHHVLRGVHIPGAATTIPGFLTQDRHPFSSEYPAADIDDFLAIPSSHHKCIQEKIDAPRRRCILLKELAFEITSRKTHAPWAWIDLTQS